MNLVHETSSTIGTLTNQKEGSKREINCCRELQNIMKDGNISTGYNRNTTLGKIFLKRLKSSWVHGGYSISRDRINIRMRKS